MASNECDDSSARFIYLLVVSEHNFELVVKLQDFPLQSFEPVTLFAVGVVFDVDRKHHIVATHGVLRPTNRFSVESFCNFCVALDLGIKETHSEAVKILVQPLDFSQS